MRKGKILPVSVFLSCCSLTAFASSHVTSADNFGKNVVVAATKANTAKVLGTQQSSGDVKVTGNYRRQCWRPSYRCYYPREGFAAWYDHRPRW